MSQTEGVHGGRRKDAVRNHERVLAAARELFTEQGLGVTVPQVAERAGVGKATVYRSYPAKQDLIVAVAREQFQQLAARTEAALQGEDAYAQLCLYVPDLFAALAADRVLGDALFDGRILPATMILAQVGELLERAAEDGPIRPGATEADVRVMLCGPVRQLIVLGEQDPAVWQRYAEMVLNAFRV
ncbi:TetR/AcrR family transcriptional regulator [Paractinoplanes atraurantiacus]|uniref:Regulatory protein, tetR family n=1 Tax=Paractinoplanes atraurantiacus TaxID=1036182 RepID=A0A285JWG6_9ACTN|nr:TetR/AcrR family transcriptional regulator [Actinoplanes atraurantiacus]SNY64679.1 regulatory protein, tetR family [Actinoplanes atraurantiacus]